LKLKLEGTNLENSLVVGRSIVPATSKAIARNNTK
jgi:hypothetical protein